MYYKTLIIRRPRDARLYQHIALFGISKVKL